MNFSKIAWYIFASLFSSSVCIFSLMACMRSPIGPKSRVGHSLCMNRESEVPPSVVRLGFTSVSAKIASETILLN